MVYAGIAAARPRAVRSIAGQAKHVDEVAKLVFDIVAVLLQFRTGLDAVVNKNRNTYSW
jgi:hypothetical protein